MDLLKTMLENRKVNHITDKAGKMTITHTSTKQEIIEKKPKHKKLKEYFETIVERCIEEEDEDD
jgi:hypothetical protein